MEALEAGGATVAVVRGDVSDAGFVGKLVEQLGRGEHPLRGVVHAAGTSSGRSLVDLNRRAFETDFAAKVRGAWLLHQATANLELDFFVLFSSAAAAWGARDMASYAAANHFLDALAQYRRHRGLPALSVNWGRWDDVGVATTDTVSFFDRVGVKPMSEQDALRALDRLLVAGASRKVVARVDWDRFKAIQETRTARPFLERIASSTRAADHAWPDAAGAELRKRLEHATPAGRLTQLTAFVQREVAGILGLDPGRPLDPSRGFVQMGLDSLLAIELRNRLQRMLGRTLPAPVIFNYPTVSALAAYLADEAAGDVRAEPRGSALADAPLREADIEAMTDEEAEALLASRVATLGRDGAR